MAVCEILSVGTELLLGDILNTDTRYLSRALASMGISVLRHSTVGDNRERLAAELKNSLERSDIIITSGGLGPTTDDLTKEVCCEVMGFELQEDSSIVEEIRSYFKSKNADMPENNKKQALIPVGGTVFKNNHGTAPGLAIEKDGKCIIMLPGPPSELEPMFEESVRDFLSKYSDGVIASHTINIIGAGESAVALELGDMFDGENPTVAPYAKQGEVQLRVTAKADTTDEADKMCEPIIKDICSRLGAIVYGVDAGNIESRVVSLLVQNKKTIACAESCTAGYIAKRITDIAGASSVFGCGIVSYSNDIKMKILGVSEETLRAHGAVSEQTAKEMALGALKVSGADIAIASTGIAGPGSSCNKEAGLSFVAVATNNFIHVQKIETGHKNDREYNRYVTASRALNLARLVLEGKIK
ncbi:MAG: competence/damage-inducible protein A [Clostridia bacterium]|nr:competence/damage-inducible protein A [Clostridia bacterium]